MVSNYSENKIRHNQKTLVRKVKLYVTIITLESLALLLDF